MTKITQADREAARPFMDRFLDGSSFADDRDDLSQAFAAHREEARAELVEALQWCVDYFDGNTRCNATQTSNCIEKCRDALTKVTPPTTKFKEK